MADKVIVFKSWSSPFPLRAIWALKLKGIEFETVLEDLSNKSPELLKYNPVYKKVPVLVHNGKPISESLVILEYIDETWSQYPIMPQDPYERAKVRFWAKFGDDKLLADSLKIGVLGKEGKEQEEAVAEAMKNFNYLEEELKGKKFFGGDRIGALDLALGWIACFVGVFEEVIGFKLIHQQNFPLLTQWIQDFGNFPLIKETWPPFDELVAKFVGVRKWRLSNSKSN